MDICEVTEILKPVYENATRGALRHVQARAGLAAATDGRVLVKVELPDFVPPPEMAE